MQGIRVNEAFATTVNWDLIPNIAIGAPTSGHNRPFGLTRSAGR